jgi:hypothetical protein
MHYNGDYAGLDRRGKTYFLHYTAYERLMQTP